MDWASSKVLVTGGASFIGSHLVDAMIERGASVRVVDDLSSGLLENIEEHVSEGRVEFIEADLRDPGVARDAVRDVQVVFHIAADHGGRGYVDLHQSGPSSNLFLDGVVFWEALKAGVDKVVFASSGCVYPNFLQSDPDEEVYLTEEVVKPPHDADNMYGWAKLMGELTLQAYYREHGLKSASCRYFTVYGPRGVENHAVIAMIAKAFIKQNPFTVWGDGTQIRNWTYVDDIVRGTILAAENIDDGTAVNLGTMERIRVLDAVKMVFDYTGHQAGIKLLPDMPTGPLNRVADNALAKKLLGWEPELKFIDGLHRTIDWYFATKDRDTAPGILERMLTER
jgi:UDP-glucose 4-epimerase